VFSMFEMAMPFAGFSDIIWTIIDIGFVK